MANYNKIHLETPRSRSAT